MSEPLVHRAMVHTLRSMASRSQDMFNLRQLLHGWQYPTIGSPNIGNLDHGYRSTYATTRALLRTRQRVAQVLISPCLNLVYHSMVGNMMCLEMMKSRRFDRDRNCYSKKHEARRLHNDCQNDDVGSYVPTELAIKSSIFHSGTKP